MFIPCLWARCPIRNLERKNDKPGWLVGALFLLVLCGTAPAVGQTTFVTDMELHQSVSRLVANGDGTYDVQVSVSISNTGSEELVNLQIEDDLDVFGSGSSVQANDLRVISGNLAVNHQFDGINNTNLLNGVDSLLPGQTAKLRFSVTVDPGSSSGPFTFEALASAEGAQSGKVAVTEAKCTFDLEWQPEMRLRKSASDVVFNQNGTYTVTFAFEARNTGNEELIQLQIEDNLEIFDGGTLVSVGAPQVVSGNLTPNPAFDGINDTRLLDGGDSLSPGQTVVLGLEVTFDPADSAGPFTNVALATAEGRHSGKAADAQAKCTFELPSETAATFEKTASEVTPNPDGTFNVTFTLDAQNTGDEELINLQFKDDLDIFGDGTLLAIETPQVLDGNLTLNPAFDGINDTHLLGGGDSLQPGESARLRFGVTFRAADEPGQCSNQAYIWTKGKHSDTRVDFYASATFGCPPVAASGISLTKTAGEVTRVDGTLFQSVPITLNVTNTGSEPLSELQIDDPLDIFGSGQAIEILDVVSSLSINDGFIQLTDSQLLSGNDTLAVGASATIAFTLVFDPADEPGPFTNFATADAVGETGDTVSDSDGATFEPLPPIEGPAISLLKSAGEVTRVDGTLFQSVPITLTVTNTGDEPLSELQIDDPLDIFGSGQAIEILRRRQFTFDQRRLYSTHRFAIAQRQRHPRDRRIGNDIVHAGV